MKKRTFILSDESENSYGFITKTSGIDLSSFRKNPVMLFNHDSDQVIGRWDNIHVEGTQLKADAVFDENDPEAMKIAGKVDNEFIKGCSIGFSIKRIESGYDKKPDVITECVLREASITAFPSNENALRLYDEDGKLLKSDEVLQFLSSKKENVIPMNKIILSAQQLVALGLTETSTDEERQAAIDAMISKNKTLTSTNQTLSEAATTEKKAKVKTLIDGAIKNLKITEAERAEWTELAEANYELAEKNLNKIQGMKTITTEVKQGNGDAKEQLSADKNAWTYDQWANNDTDGLKKLSMSDPAKFKQLQDAKVDAVRAKGIVGDWL